MVKKSEAKKSNVKFDTQGEGWFSSFFKGLSSLVDLADKVSKEGGIIEKRGEFGIKKDMNGVYGFSVRTMTGPGGVSQPIVRSFGDMTKITKVKKNPHPKHPIVEEAREPLIDVFDEGNFIRVVAELPGVSDSEIVCEVQGNDVVQISTTGKKKYSKEILLNTHIEPKSLAKNYANGVLEIKLEKQ